MIFLNRKSFAFFTSILLFLILINVSFSFSILDLDGNDRIYFSPQISDVVIKELKSNNFSKVIIYPLNIQNNESINFTYNLTNCSIDENYICSKFSIYDLIEVENHSFIGANKYMVKIGNRSKYFYFDFKKPTFNFLNYSYDRRKSIFAFNFSYFDDLSGIDKIDLYINYPNTNSYYLANLLNLTNFSFKINQSKFDLKFYIIDKAGNYNEYIENFDFIDIIPPEIEILKINEDLDNNKELYLKIKDENKIKNILIYQDNLSFNYMPNKNEVGIKLPLIFKDFNFNIYLEDNYSNNISKNIIIDKFNIFEIKNISNSKIFSIKTNANSCKLILFNNTLVNLDFYQNDGYFNVDLNDFIKNSKIYNLVYECENQNYKKEYKISFLFDNISPSSVFLNYTKNNDGTLELFWNKSYDNFNYPLKYILYKNDRKIYTGRKTKFVDSNVIYPNIYQYYIVVEDIAKNRAKSNIINLTPKKVNLNFQINLDKPIIEIESNDLTINIKTDPNTNVKVDIFDINNSKIFSKYYINKTKIVQTINLNTTKAILKINAKDNFNNTKNFTYKIINNYLLNKKLEENSSKQDLVQIKKNKERLNQTLKNSIQKNLNFTKINKNNDSAKFNNNYNYFWYYLLIIILIIIFIAYFYGKKEEYNVLGNRKKDKNNIFDTNEFLFSRKKDGLVEKKVKDLSKKLEENKKLKQKEEKLKRNKKQKSSLEYESLKLKDLSSEKNKTFQLNLENIKNKKSNKINKKSKSKDNEKMKKLFESFKLYLENISFENFLKKEQEEEKEDELLEYIRKRENKRLGWSSTKEYLLKTKLEKEARKLQKQKEKEQKEREKLLEKQKKEEELRKKQEEKQRKEEEKKRKKQEEEIRKKALKTSLDDYLENVSKKRRLFFAEREVENFIKKKFSK